MPTIGLGTGGLVPGEETYTTMETANKYFIIVFNDTIICFHNYILFIKKIHVYKIIKILFLKK